MVAPKLERLKAADVCQIAQVQPYVLRTWEAEFPDLGQQTASGPRIYGRADVERVLRIRELVYVEGLTLAGARRRLEETSSGETAPPVEDFVVVDGQTRARIRRVREGLQSVLALLDRPADHAPFALVAAAEPEPGTRTAKGARKAKRSA
ncbi:MAG: MerR family transcriptional regulator [Vicinamibacterales bacterium]